MGGLKGRIARLEREAEGEIIVVRQKDGTVRRYADGPVFGPFRAGRFAKTNCSFAGDCSLVLYPAPDTVVLDATARVTRITFSPDGAYVAVFERGDHIRPSSLRVIDARSGHVTRLDVEDSRSTGVAEQGWSPDSTVFVFLSGRSLRVHAVTTGATTTVADGLPRDAVLLGVA